MSGSMFSVIPLWLHIIAATIWVGSQIMMFAVVVPSLRRVESGVSRSQILEVVTTRFGYLGLIALAVLIASGIENIDRYAPGDMFEFRYGYILAAKLIMFGLVLVLTVIHTLVIGPALLRMQTQALSADNFAANPELAALRRRSILISLLTLLLSLAIVFAAALLRAPFAFHLV